MTNDLVPCPDCLGDGKETCHNPDHGFISMMSWHDIGRLGCPGCGHDEKHKVGNGADCETCSGSGKITEVEARAFCENMGYEFAEVMEAADDE